MNTEKNDFIQVKGAAEHNLKNVDIKIPKNKVVVISGPSGSGKSSFAFNTIYAEGKRRYMSNISNYAKQFLNLQKKPAFESITGLAPAIAIDQKNVSNNPRSNVATITEIYDFLRVMFSRISHPYSPTSGAKMEKKTISQIKDIIKHFPVGTKIRIRAAFINNKKGSHIREIQRMVKSGYGKIIINNNILDATEAMIVKLNKDDRHTLEVVVDRIIIAENIDERIFEAVSKAINISGNSVGIEVVEFNDTEINEFTITGYTFKLKQVITISQSFFCTFSGISVKDPEPNIFSFNSPHGMCPSCHGIGYEEYFLEELIVPDPTLSLNQCAIKPVENFNPKYYGKIFQYLSEKYNFSFDTPYGELPENVKNILMHGTKEMIKIVHENGIIKEECSVPFLGIMRELEVKLRESDDIKILNECYKYQSRILCRNCNGHRLNEKSLLFQINHKNIGEVCNMSVSESLEWFHNTSNILSENDKNICKESIQEIVSRLKSLDDVGLGYLQLNRSADTLSGGESQRVRLASQISSGLTGVIYVLDEPSIGLHQSDNQKLITALHNIKNAGNSVIVIEHDEDTILQADYVIDFGPKAGKDGGYVIAEGTPEEIKKNPKSITGRFISGVENVQIPQERRVPRANMEILIKNAYHNNLKNIDVKFPVGLLTAVCGVSGGGKSTIVNDILYKAVAKKINRAHDNPGLHSSIKGLDYIDKIISIDQSPIGRTPRSNPATYIGLFNFIRNIFVATPEARNLGLDVGKFSFNVKGGRCEKCQGDGFVKIEMHFLPDVYVECTSCQGKRYNHDILDIKYRGYSIADIFSMTPVEALNVFEDVAYIKDKLTSLIDVGLDYISLGQPSNELSGGEAQRIKLAKELSKKSTGNTLYILDEPTTGLHMSDIKKLLNVLHSLVDHGNTVIVIEHNLDVIKTADYVIDVGPVGGKKGGYIVSEGTPEKVAADPKSVTGKYIKEILERYNVK